MRALREPVSVAFTPLFAPVFTGCMGLIFGNNPLSEFGGEGSLETNFTAFPGTVIAISALIIIPIDLVAQREVGVLRRPRATPLNPTLYLAVDVVSRLTLGLASFVVTYTIVALGFGIRPTSTGVFISIPAATMLGLAAFLAAGCLIAGRFCDVGAAQGLGNILMYPLAFTSGVAIPLAMLPPSTLSITEYSSMTQLTYLTRGLWDGGGWGEHWIATPILLVSGTVCVVTAARFFCWG